MLNIDEQPRTLRTVSDFAAVPPGQLPGCLRAFRHWLQVQAAPAAAPEAAAAFVWMPPAPAPAAGAQPPTPTTDIGELGLRPGAVQQFRRMNIFVLEDFTTVSRADMGRLVNVGSATVNRIRDLLRSVGLDFRAPDQPPSGPRAAPTPPAREPAAFGDETALAGLRLKPQTLGKLVLHGLGTVGDLRDLLPEQLAALLSVRRRQEVFRLLRARGLNLRSQPTEFELWRHGLVHLCELQRPPDEASVLSLQPWFGAAMTGAARTAGIDTVGQLRALAASGATPPRVHGIGPYSWNRIRKFFLARQPAPATAVP